MKTNEIIKKGVKELEKISDVKWHNESGKGKLTKNNFIEALEQSIIKDIPLWKIIGYKNKNCLSQAMRKIATNIENRPKVIFWKNFILRLSGYKFCNKCKILKLISAFSIDNSQPEGINYICNLCEKDLHLEKRKETTLHIIDVMIKENKLPECSICGYKENWAALDFHHIDSELERPYYTYDKNGKKRQPSDYIFGCRPKKAEKRYLKEINNLELLCSNCHIKNHATYKRDTSKGLRESIIKLGYEYKCEICNTDTNLHLHHNNPEEKEFSFVNFSSISKNKIINDGLLEKEMNKDVEILCSNHHREYHNPKWEMSELIPIEK